jgi:hypothetical protein
MAALFKAWCDLCKAHVSITQNHAEPPAVDPYCPYCGCRVTGGLVEANASPKPLKADTQ